jgi:glutamate:GABA antiporter
MWLRRRQRARVSLAGGAAPDHGRLGPGARPARPPARKFISWPRLAVLTVASAGSLGSAPALAVFGLAPVFLYVLPALVFLLPVSLVAAELSSG